MLMANKRFRNTLKNSVNAIFKVVLLILIPLSFFNHESHNGIIFANSFSTTAIKIISRIAENQVSWEKNMLPPFLAAIAKKRLQEQVSSGNSQTLSDVALKAKTFALTNSGEWSSVFHFWHVPLNVNIIKPNTGSCMKTIMDSRNPCIWKAALNYTSKIFDEYGSSAAGASGGKSSVGVPSSSSLGFMVDLYSDLHSPVRMGPTTNYGKNIKVQNIQLNSSLPKISESNEFDIWEADEFLFQLIRWKGYLNWTHYADSLLKDKRLVDPKFRKTTDIDFGEIGCFDSKLIQSMFSTWANESATLLRAEKCLASNSCKPSGQVTFFQNIANLLELRMLTCAMRIANAMDLLFITPPDNVISPLCKKKVPFSLDNNILAISVTIVFVLAAMLFFCVFLPKIKKAQEMQQRPYSPNSPESDSSSLSNGNRRNYQSI